MAFRRYGSFTGGIDLPDEKRQALTAPVRLQAAPERLAVPLAPCGHSPAGPCVEMGQRVAAGQRIAVAAGGDGVDVFAPLAGQVAGETTVRVAVWGGFADSPAIELADLADPAAGRPAGDRAFPQRGVAQPDAGGPEEAADGLDWAAAAPDELRRRIAAGGLALHRRVPRPLGAWAEQAARRGCRLLIANVLEQEPYVTADHRLLAERGPEVLEGLAILGKAIAAGEAVLAADRRRTQHYQDLAESAERYGIQRIALPHKYPVGADTILTKVLTRREIPPGAGTMEVGVAIVDAATCLAVRRWVVRGWPATGRVVTLAGPRMEEPRTIWAPFGANCAELARASRGGVGGPDGALLVHGGPMSGLWCDERAVVTPATCAVLALDDVDPPIPTPCIRCGWCTDHCPARLNVSALNDAFELSLVERARRLGALACVECGVCSYICPARLPLAQRVKQLKRPVLALRRAGAAAASPGAPRRGRSRQEAAR